jgi:translocation and assembly module TamB
MAEVLVTERPVPPIDADTSVPSANWRRIFTRLLFLVVVLAAAVWLAPTVVARTSLRQQVPRLLFPTLSGRITIGSASLDWMRPVDVRQVQLWSAQGELLAEVGHLEGTKPLWQLLVQPADLGTYRFSQTTLQLAVEGSQTSWDQTLIDLSQGSGEPSAVRLELIDALLNYAEHETDRKWELPGLNVTVDCGHHPDHAVTMQLEWQPTAKTSAAIAQAGPASEPSALLTLRQDRQGALTGEWTAEQFSLEALSAWTKPWTAGLHAEGTLTGRGTWTYSQQRLSAETELSIQQLVARGAEWLQGDRLELPRLELSGGVQLADQTVQLQNVLLKSDILTINGSGQAPWTLSPATGTSPATTDTAASQATPLTASTDATSAVATSSPTATLQCTGQLQLAKLAQQWPHVLRLKDGTAIESGQLTFTLNSQPRGHLAQWRADLQLQDLLARAGDITIRPTTPFTANVSVITAAEVPAQLERAVLRSDYAELDATGNAEQLQAQFSANLDRLVRDWESLIDLQGWRMTGAVSGAVDMTSPSANSRDIALRVKGTQLDVISPTGTRWNESDWSAQMNTRFAGTPANPWQQSQPSQFQWTAGEDRLQCQTTAPVSWQSSDARWPIKLVLTGDLARWQARLSPWLGDVGWTIAGQAQLQAEGTWSPTTCELVSARLQGRPFQATSADWAIKDEQLLVETAGQLTVSPLAWSSPLTKVTGDLGSITIRDLTAPLSSFVSSPSAPISSVSQLSETDARSDAQSELRPELRPVKQTAESTAASNATVGTTAAVSANRANSLRAAPAPAWSGRSDFDVELPRLSRWQRKPTYHFMGRARGSVQASLPEDKTVAQADITITNAALVGWDPPLSGQPGRWSHRWTEPTLTVRANAVGNATGDDWKFEQLALQASGLSLQTQGRIQQRSNETRFAVKGEITHDWDQLLTRVDPQWLETFRCAGQGTQPLQLQGVWPRQGDWTAAQLQGTLGLSWTSAELLGMAVGPAQPTLQFQGTSAELLPLTLPLSAGNLRLAASLPWQPAPVVLTIAPGRLAENMQLTPELCRRWMKLTLPMAAETTEAQGQFSIDVASAQFPIADWTAGQAQSTLEIAQARVQPGPLSQRLLTVVEQIRALAENRAPRPVPLDRIRMELPPQTVQTVLAQRRVRHDRLELWLGDLRFITSGSVGFDETLDLVADVTLPESLRSNPKVAAVLPTGQLRVPVTGTVQTPQIDPRVLTELVRRSTTDRVERVIENELQKQLNRLLPRRE